MIRRPVPAWLDLARGDALSDTAGEGTGVPLVDAPRRGENDNGGAMPPLGLAATDPDAALLPRRATPGRRLGVMAALVLSGVIHAGAFVLLADRFSVEGVEAETDGVSVEIVFDSQAASASPAIAGNDGDASVDADTAEVVEPMPAEAVEPEVLEANQTETMEMAEPVEQVGEAVIVEPSAVTDTVAELAETVDVAVAEPVETRPVEVTPADAEPVVVEEPAVVAEVLEAIEPETVEAEAIEPVEAIAAEAAAPVAPAREPAPSVDADLLEASVADTAATVEPLSSEAAAMPPIASESTVAEAIEPVEALAKPEPALDEPIEDPLPQTVERVPEPRPEPPATVTAKAEPAPRRAPKPASTSTPTRTVEPSRSNTAAKTEPRAKPAPAKADTGARTGTKPAAAASAGSQARAAAAPGAEAKYGRALLSHVERHKRYPAAARSAGISGATRLAITIDRTGGLAGARVSSGSGHRILDDEALAVARRAAPYPRPPEGVGGSTFSFAVTLRFAR